MSKYQINLFLSIVILIALIMMDFHQSMTPFWIGPYLSASINFDWLEFTLYVNWDEIKEFSKLSNSDMFTYNFTKMNDLTLYDYLAKGLVVILIIAKKIFFWQGDLESLQSLQYIVHLILSIFLISLLKKNYQKVLFFLFYAINPIILYFVNYPYYYFWQVIPSVLFSYWYFNQDKIKNILYLYSFIFAFIYITRPTVLFLILLFYILYMFRTSFKIGFLNLILFLTLINIAPNLSIGPWHTMYVGIGAYDNKYNINLDDGDGYKYYESQTAKIVNSSNIMNSDIKKNYYKVLKNRYIDILNENPTMLFKNAILNIFESYSIGYKVGSKNIIYFSAITGLFMIVLLLYTKQYILFFAIGFSGGSFSLYFPPIGAYMYGSYILIVLSVIGIIDFFILKRGKKNEK